jgi:hypothetical protein
VLVQYCQTFTSEVLLDLDSYGRMSVNANAKNLGTVTIDLPEKIVASGGWLSLTGVRGGSSCGVVLRQVEMTGFSSLTVIGYGGSGGNSTGACGVKFTADLFGNIEVPQLTVTGFGGQPASQTGNISENHGIIFNSQKLISARANIVGYAGGMPGVSVYSSIGVLLNVNGSITSTGPFNVEGYSCNGSTTSTSGNHGILWSEGELTSTPDSIVSFGGVANCLGVNASSSGVHMQRATTSAATGFAMRLGGDTRIAGTGPSRGFGVLIDGNCIITNITTIKKPLVIIGETLNGSLADGTGVLVEDARLFVLGALITGISVQGREGKYGCHILSPFTVTGDLSFNCTSTNFFPLQGSTDSGTGLRIVSQAGSLVGENVTLIGNCLATAPGGWGISTDVLALNAASNLFISATSQNDSTRHPLKLVSATIYGGGSIHVEATGGGTVPTISQTTTKWTKGPNDHACVIRILEELHLFEMGCSGRHDCFDIGNKGQVSGAGNGRKNSVVVNAKLVSELRENNVGFWLSGKNLNEGSSLIHGDNVGKSRTVRTNDNGRIAKRA